MFEHIAILGFGVEGESIASYLLKENPSRKITVLYEKESDATNADSRAQWEKRGVRFLLGPITDLTRYTKVFRSPGIRPDRPAILAAKKSGAILTSATEVFMEQVPCPIIGVTGTKGKGTTASLIYELLKADGRDCYLGGNIGVAPLSFLSALTPNSIVVLEMSSFQLFTCTRSPHIAVIVLTTVDHLDYHPDVAEYISAKSAITKHQGPEDVVVSFGDYPHTRAVASGGNAKTRLLVSATKHTVSGTYIDGDAIWWRENGSDEKIIDGQDIFIPGRHNWENAAAAVAVGKTLGIGSETIRSVLKTFKGLPHRIQFVGEKHGVRFYDDSFSTTPETAIAAIRAFREPKVIILGGSSKGSDFTELGEVIGTTANIRAIIGIGVEWLRIKERIVHGKLTQTTIVEGCKNMEEIVAAAKKSAKPGDVVLLSPACASFDMFKNYKERGEQFITQVNRT